MTISNADPILIIKNIRREDVLDAIREAEKKPLPPGERFSLLYQGARYCPKHVLASAYRFNSGRSVNVADWSELAYEPFIEKLEELNFRIVKNPKNIEAQTYPVMIYEVKKPDAVQANYKRLFSSDRKFFYWNNDKFSQLKQGDAVFVVNSASREVLYAFAEKLHIKTEYNEQQDVTTFADAGEQFEVPGNWGDFISLRVREACSVPEKWKWKTLGSGEHTYLRGPNVSEGTALNNLERVNLLLEVFDQPNSESEVELSVCYKALESIAPTQAITPKPPTTSHAPAIWYVMQGKTFNERQGKKYLWAPLKNEKGTTFVHWQAVGEVKVGDIIVHHAEGAVQGLSKAISPPRVVPDPFSGKDWSGDGNQVDIEILVEFDPPIGLDKIRQLQTPLAEALADKRGPYNSAGTGNQGYLFEYSWEALSVLLTQTKSTLPKEISRWLPAVEVEMDAVIDEVTALPDKSTETKPHDWLSHVQKYMHQKGFYYSLNEVKNFYLSLHTKPFVILAGISGTGKTQIARQFAKAVGYGDERHCVLIPVRPDWSDNTDLIGYRNIQGQFVQQTLLRVLQDALAHPNELFFVILDEMNLARVEHYFSDFLSILETRERNRDGIISTDALVTDSTVNRGVPVTIPQNLMFVGTVNMDETTHPFSRKVLDRANALEMNDIDLNWTAAPKDEVPPLEGIFADALVSSFLNSVELEQSQRDALQDVVGMLVEINGLLEPAGLHFGYRVRDEIAFYLTRNRELGLLDEETALDYQLMQKVLPRIQGSSISVLKAMLLLLAKLSGIAQITVNTDFDEVEKLTNPAETKYPRSVSKLLFMLRRFNDDGFTSFWL